MNAKFNSPGRQSGFSMIEVLVTIIILMVGLLGLAGLQVQGLRSEMESYQRVQALILLQDMAGRINANRANAANYVSNNTIGTGDTQPTDCTLLTVGQTRDLCEWSNALKGAGEKAGSSSTAASIGAMLGGRGCITLVNAATKTYQISVAWQGMGKSFQTTNTCGQNANAYGSDDTLRRVVSLTTRIGDLSAP